MTPKTTNPKNIQLNVLVDESTANAIETLARELGISKSELVRMAINDFIAKNVQVILKKLEIDIALLEKAKNEIEEIMKEEPYSEVLAYDVFDLRVFWCSNCEHLREYGHCVREHNENLCRQWGCLRTVEEWYQYVTNKLAELGKKLANLKAL